MMLLDYVLRDRFIQHSATQDIEGADRSQFALMLKAAIWCIASPEKHFAEVRRPKNGTQTNVILFP